ncbi:AraC family transcriptional regulator [Marinobacterium sp. YM272]|uniref:AraC family transcriptional regulator n=1 Tax=Marinobacterium sp. YM272 TaxID=3421654 RepID=UPI003D7FADD0
MTNATVQNRHETAQHTAILQARSSVLTGFTELCRRHHINPMQMLARENLGPAVLRSQDLHIPYESCVRVLYHAARESGYPLFSLTLSLRHGIEALGPLGLMASQSASLGEALGVVQKYLHFHAQGVQLELVQQGSEARLIYDVRMNRNIDLTQLMELGIGRIHNVLRSLAPAGMKISGVRFRHEPLAPVCEYAALLGLTPSFSSQENSVSFPAAFLSKPPAPASDRVRLYFESFLTRIGQSHARPLKHQVVRLIHDLIPTGEASAASVAGLLGLHTRSLQRQLKLIDTDFRTLLEEVRYERAKEILANTDTPVTDLALQLGYSELSAFSRAFKSWSGLSPQQWRQQHSEIAI